MKALFSETRKKEDAMKRFIRVTGVLFLAGLFLTFGPSLSVAAQNIKVGIVLPLTGDQAKFGEIEKRSFDLALEEINAAGGVKGSKLEFVIEDDTGRPEVGRSVVEKLITKDKVVMLGGGYSSSVTYAVAGVCQQNQMLFRQPGPQTTLALRAGFFFRLNPGREYAGHQIPSEEVVKPSTAVILHENSLFGTSEQEFEKTCEGMQVQVLLKEGYEAGGIDYKPVLMKVKQLNPDIVYMVSYIMDASLLMKQAKELKLTPKMFIGGAAGFTLPEFKQNAGVASEKVISATLWHEVLPYPGAMDYYKKFVAKFKQPTEYHGAEAYAAAYVIADALKRAKSFSTADIKQALSETNLMTVFGPVKFTNYGKHKNQNKLPTYVVQWIDGKLEMVWPADLGTKKFVFPIDWLKAWGY
jgi:branched-chain amino acid transport system substrate-binding protein